MAKKKYAKKLDNFNSNSSDEECLSVNSHDRNSETILTPERMRKQIYSPMNKDIEEEIKQPHDSNNAFGYLSDGSDKASIPEEAIKDDNLYGDE